MERLYIGHWSLITGHWSLVTGHWSLFLKRSFASLKAFSITV